MIDLKNEFKNIKNDNYNIKKELIMLKIDKSLDKPQSDNEHDEHKDVDESSQQALLSDKGIADNSQLSLVHKLIPPKWFTKVKIVVSPDYHFIVIAMIDSGANMNCIQEGLIPSKYFEKSTENLVSTNGSHMKIKYELNNAYVCHDNVCFKIPFVLIKNLTDKVILGLPFINALYPFLVEHDGITTDPFRQKVKFKFASKTEIDIDDLSYEKDSPMNALIQELMMSSCQCFTDDFKGNIHSTNTINRPNIINTSLQESDDDAWISTTNKWDNSNIYTYTTSKWIIMAPKGKAPVQDYSQNKRLPTGQPFRMHESASSGVKPSRATSLQRNVPAEVTYSNGDMIIALQEVLSRNLQFHNGIYSELLDSIKLLITFNLLLLETTVMFFRKPSKLLKSTLLTLLLKMMFMQATMLTLFQKKPLLQKMTLFQKMRLLESNLLTIQILQMIPTLVNSLAKRISIQRIK